MKKIILGLSIIAAFASCKKDDDKVSCDVSVAAITANYKITKIVGYFPSPLPDQDITNTVLPTSCEQNGIYQLKSDKTVTYTEAGGCVGNDTGTWDVVSGKVSIDAGSVSLTDMTVTNWDCSTLTLSLEAGAGVGTRYTFSKQ